MNTRYNIILTLIGGIYIALLKQTKGSISHLKIITLTQAGCQLIDLSINLIKKLRSTAN